jgi:hypothetical protein
MNDSDIVIEGWRGVKLAYGFIKLRTAVLVTLNLLFLLGRISKRHNRSMKGG